MKIDEKTYMVFCLIGDDLSVSKILRSFAYKNGMDTAYDKAANIVNMFLKYDKENLHHSMYDNFLVFVEDNESKIINYINGGEL